MSSTKEGGLPQALSSDSTQANEQPLVEAKSASVPVVVLGANVGGVAAAVAIRSRTGRAVCVLDVKGEEEARWEGTDDVPSYLSARCLDAVRAINADLQRSVLTSLEEDATPVVYGTGSSVDLGARLSTSHLRDILVSHLTTGQGGASFVWRCSSLSRIFMDVESDNPSKDKGRNTSQEGGRSVVLMFDNGVRIRTELLVVATAAVPVHALISAERSLGEGEGDVSEEIASEDEVYSSKGSGQPNELEAALLNEAERKALSLAASLAPSVSSVPTTSSESPGEELSSAEEKRSKGHEEWTPAHTIGTTPSLSTVLTSLKLVRSFNSRCNIPKGADSPWSFNEGHVVLTGAAAHPWASSLCDGLELDLEDAAQLGCSLFDWKFQVRMASDRFQAIRKRRLAAVLTSPKIAMSLSAGESPDTAGDASTTASPAMFCEEDQTYVPTRDAYAELLPSVGLAYEVQEARVY